MRTEPVPPEPAARTAHTQPAAASPAAATPGARTRFRAWLGDPSAPSPKRALGGRAALLDGTLPHAARVAASSTRANAELGGRLDVADPRRIRAERDDDAALAALGEPGRFAPPPAVLVPAPTASASGGADPAWAPAQLAALAERLLTSVRVGRSRDGGSLVRVRVDGGGRGDLEVELRETREGLIAVVSAQDGDHARADAWAARLGDTLRARGLELHALEVA